MTLIKRMTSACLAILVVVNLATAQDMSIYTQIRLKSNDAAIASGTRVADQQPIVRSLMLFHSGKIYDYIEPAREITVFEPALRRFTILNRPLHLKSVLTQEQIRHFLSLAKNEAKRHLVENLTDTSAPNQKSLALLQFQLEPDFAVEFDSTKAQLSLKSPYLQYTAFGTVPKMPEIVENYLHVADWTAQINSVLHPQSQLPGPRLVLNQELRERGLVPLSVELKIQLDPSIHLIASHEWIWNLRETDRQMIAEWEKLMQDPNLRTLEFRQFQQEVLKTDLARRR